jgi:dienelactone hydrolase
MLFATLASTAVAEAEEPTPAELKTMCERVLALGQLEQPPKVYEIDKADAVPQGPRRLYFEGLPYRGKPTRVFAWYGEPTSAEGKLPAMVLVHGGGGSAFKEWVELWNEHGYVAISLAVEGQTDEHLADGKQWKRHEWAGPARDGIFADADKPIDEQWMYHAVADVVLANSLLRSLPNVDREKIGLMGISWGGIVTSTVIGIDNRFVFAVPTYGCGALDRIDNQYGRALGRNDVYKQVWNPLVRGERATMPALWLTWLYDPHFPLDAQQATYRADAGPRMVSVIPDMKHSHGAGWKPEDSYAFADSVVQTGRPWLKELRQQRHGDRVEVDFTSTKAIDRAVILFTSDRGYTGNRKWIEASADLQASGENVRVTAALPPGARAYFVNVRAGNLTGSSEYQEIGD